MWSEFRSLTGPEYFLLATLLLLSKLHSLDTLRCHLGQFFTLLLVTVQEPGQAEHPAAGSARELGPVGQVSDRLCDGVQRDHRTHLQVRLALWWFLVRKRWLLRPRAAAERGRICLLTATSSFNHAFVADSNRNKETCLSNEVKRAGASMWLWALRNKSAMQSLHGTSWWRRTAYPHKIQP